jgi:hypothetical protein
MKNLMQTGALTIPPPVLYEGEDNAASKGKNRYLDPRHKPRITALGKIFVNLPVDLKITRIFLFEVHAPGYLHRMHPRSNSVGLQKECQER